MKRTIYLVRLRDEYRLFQYDYDAPRRKPALVKAFSTEAAAAQFVAANQPIAYNPFARGEPFSIYKGNVTFWGFAENDGDEVYLETTQEFCREYIQEEIGVEPPSASDLSAAESVSGDRNKAGVLGNRSKSGAIGGNETKRK